MIHVSALKKIYGSTVAVDDVSFELKPGEVVGLLGPNGAGKTTTMRMITGYLQPSSGTVRVGEYDTREEPLRAKALIGYLPENNPLYQDMTVREYLRYVGELRQVRSLESRIKEIAVQVGLHDRLHQEIAVLSKGYKQRVGLAAALIHDPEVLVLDEPTSGLDPNQIIEIRNFIKTLGKKKTILLSTLILSEAESTCDRILIINKGRVVASGTAHELRSAHQGKALIRVKIEGAAHGLLSVLRDIPGVIRAFASDQEAGDTSVFEIETEGSVDLRKDITQKVVGGGYALIEIQRESKSLEDVFAVLTQSNA